MQTWIIWALALGAVLALNQDLFTDTWKREKDAFLRSKGRLRPTPNPFVESDCGQFIGDIGSKLRQMREAQDPFLFSQAGLEVGGTEDRHVDPSLWIEDDDMMPPQKYTRFAFVLPARLSDEGQTFEKRFRYTADPEFSETACSAVSDECGSTQQCEIINAFNVSMRVGKTRVEYSLIPRNFGPNLPLQLSRVASPFLYYPVDEAQANVSAAAASLCGTTSPNATSSMLCTQGTSGRECRFGDHPCEPATIFDAVDANVVAAHCGAKADPVGVFDTRLNQQCVVHCCSNVTTSVHRRWAASPLTYMFDIISTPTLVVDLQVNVTRLIDGATRTVSLQNLRRGDGALSEEQDVRLLVNDVVGDLSASTPALGNTGLVVWSNATGVGHVNQTDDPSVNPYPAGMGVTPTRRNLGTSFGWAFLNATARGRWTQGSGYGSMQAHMTLPGITGFGTAAACAGDGTYEENRGVPGWELRPNTSVARVEDPCRISHYLNDLTDVVAGAVNPAALNITEMPGTYYLPPNYNLEHGNFYLFEGMRLIYEFFPDTLEDFPNLIVRSPGRSVPPSRVAESAQLTTSLTEVYLDISEVFIDSFGLAGSGGFGNASACSVGLSTGVGTLYYVLSNSNFGVQGEYSVLNQCTSSDSSQLEITEQPGDVLIQVDAQEQGEVFRGFSVSAAENTTASVTCTATLFVVETATLVQELTVECRIFGSVVKEEDVAAEDESEGGMSVWNIVFIALAGLLGLVLIGVVAWACYSESKSRKAKDALQE